MWTEADIKEFWEGNTADFAGDVSAPEIVRLTRKYIKDWVLDVGAGSGALMRSISSLGRMQLVMGVDIAPKHSSVTLGDISSLGFQSGILSTVFATEVLEHLPIETLVRGLAEVRRVLHKGGILIVTVPNNENKEMNMVSCPDCKTRFHRWGHLRSFNKDSLNNLLEKSGFTIVESRELPIGLMAKHKVIHYLWPLFVRMGLFSCDSLLVVARKS